MAEFSEMVWELAKNIPKGKVTTYNEIAKAVGNPRACRAVGQALKRNSYAPMVPCHRVINWDGSVGGFRGSTVGKEKSLLLAKEGLQIINNRIDMNKHKHAFSNG